jgi:putative membrane protein
VAHDTALSLLHFTFAFVLAGALSAEAFVMRLPVDGGVARLLLRIDLFYGASAVGVILAGLSRALFGAKGWEYYAAQPFFWAKIATLALIGLLSIVPTLAFFRWVKAVRADATSVIAESEVKRVRSLVMIELHGLVLVLAFAALMARGIGS